MAYRPRPYTTTSAPTRAVNYDKDRTSLIIHNTSGETCYRGVDPTLAVSGNHQGAPIAANGNYEANFINGRDPRNEVWLVGTAGGTVIIDEDRAEDPYLEATQRLTDAVNRIVGRL